MVTATNCLRWTFGEFILKGGSTICLGVMCLLTKDTKDRSSTAFQHLGVPSLNTSSNPWITILIIPVAPELRALAVHRLIWWLLLPKSLKPDSKAQFIIFTDCNTNHKLTLYSLFPFYNLQEQTWGSHPARDNKLLVTLLPVWLMPEGKPGQCWSDCARWSWGYIRGLCPQPSLSPGDYEAASSGGISLPAHPLASTPGKPKWQKRSKNKQFLTKI